MDRKKRKLIIINSIAIATIVIVFMIVNIWIDTSHKRRLSFVPDGPQYCYGIDSSEKEGNVLTIKGWFLEMKSVRSIEDELMLALVPLDREELNDEAENAVFLKTEKTKTDRSDVSEYLSSKCDNLKCGFTATVDCGDLSLEKTAYRLVIKPDAMRATAVLSSLYLTDKGLMYTDPAQSPVLDTDGTDLDRIAKEGVRLVSRPDFGCYVYQLGKELYWIVDETFWFSEDGATYIYYKLGTNQVGNLSEESLENDCLWIDKGDLFESHEITGQIDCGKYRVSSWEIPSDLSVTDIVTGHFYGQWGFMTEFKPFYAMLIK